MYAKRHHRCHYSSSDSGVPDTSRNKGEERRKARPPRRRPGCYVCESPEHTVRNCPWREKFKAYVKKRIAKDKAIRKKKQKSKDQALVAERNRSDDWYSDSELDHLDEEELAALSKEMVSRLPKNTS